MIIYAAPKTSVTIDEAISGLKGLCGDERLIAWGMLEQGLADVGIDLGEDLPRNLPAGLHIDLKIPEGFAFYQLYPAQYRRAAHKWLQASAPKGPVVVIGLRSIGTTLSRVVWQELQSAGVETVRCTVRPAGDPFQRTVELPESVSSKAESYLIVDEGPGLSGSSFISVARALEQFGVERRRIHFFPSHHHPPGAAASKEAQIIWQEISKWVEPPQLPQLDTENDWKFIGPALPWPFDCSGQAERCARRNAELSCGVPVEGKKEWWLASRKIQARTAKVSIEAIADHILAVADDPLRIEDEIETEARLREMVEVNLAKHFKDEKLNQKVRDWQESLVIERGRKSSGDGQLRPKNWVRDGNGKLWKRDTTGSKLSHFVPYRLPVLWDVAQAIVEWNLQEKAEVRLCEKMRAGNLPFRVEELEFFKMAVATFELGRCVLLGGGEMMKYHARLLQTAEGL